MTLQLHGRTAIVSGGLGDIGKATVLALAEAGVDVGFCDLKSESEAQPLLVRLEALGRRGHYRKVDVADAQAVSAWVDAVTDGLAVPDLIIVNAATVSLAPLEELTPQVWRRELSVNLDGAFNLANAATRRLVATGRKGRVVFVGSWAADHVHLHIPTYCVGKAGLRMLMKCMAAALAPKGILVNEIAPGFVDAGLASQFMEADPASRESSRRAVPTQNLITSEEVAAQIVRLLDPANRHMAGSTLLMDGGLSLFGSGTINGG